MTEETRRELLPSGTGFEDKNSGAQLIQDVRRESMLDVSGAGPPSGQDPSSMASAAPLRCEGQVKPALV